MIDTARLVRASMAWISILYIVCFDTVVLYPQVRPLFARYALHIEVSIGENVITLTTFIIGLVLWNFVALLCVGRFAVLFNKIK
jgi:hypothetical protein